MFPRDDRIRFERRVHEQVAPSIQRCGLPILFVDVQVVHTGYADPDARMRKARRNLRLLEMDVAERPDDIHEVSALADAACAVGDTRRGVSLYRRAFDLLPLEDPARAQIAVSLAGCHRLLGEPTDAEAWIARALDLEPAKIDALFLGAQLSVDAGDTRRAMALLEQTIRAEPQATSTAAPDTTPIRGLALVLLARLHVRSDDPAAAEPLYRRAVEDFPMILDARLELAELLFRGPRNKEAAALFDSVVRMHPRPPRALIARANDVRKRARRFGGPAPEHV
jgi:tetratricopeptide (TPR) repeat protein